MHKALFKFFIIESWYARISNFFRGLGKRFSFWQKGLRISFTGLPKRLVFRGVGQVTLKQGEKRYIDIEATKPLDAGCTAIWNLRDSGGNLLLSNQTATVTVATRLVSALWDTTSYSPGNYTVEFIVTNENEKIIHCESVTVQA